VRSAAPGERAMAPCIVKIWSGGGKGRGQAQWRGSGCGGPFVLGLLGEGRLSRWSASSTRAWCPLARVGGDGGGDGVSSRSG
jgi:hypothetical protein